MLRRQVTDTVSYMRKGSQVASAALAVSKLSKLASGVVVVTSDHKGPVSSLAVVAHAGTRCEEFPGISQFWKQLVFRNKQDASIVKTIRETELRGDSIYSAYDREMFVVGTEFLRDNLVDAVPLLFSNFFNKNLESYEFLDARTRLIHESRSFLADPMTLLTENLHKAAFRRGLGHSMFASQEDLFHLKRRDLFEFSEKFFHGHRLTVVGSGVNHQDLLELADENFPSLTHLKNHHTPIPKYHGGEIHVDAGPDSTSRFMLGFETNGRQSHDYHTARILESLLDGHSHLQWSATPSSGLLRKCSHGNTKIKSMYHPYSDTGLFGLFFESEESHNVKPSVESSLSALRSIADGKVTETDLHRAKNDAIIRYDSKNRGESLLSMARNVFDHGNVSKKENVVASLMKVSPNQISQMAQKMLSGKISVSVHGPASLPYLDELKI